ncbi:MAG: DnaJ domain-containing protein [Candidatus Marsarchaeota archaeon]|nr:DnaJ domain-containing protein [Candidatus Marsarchaeota archaeon]
MPQTIVKHITKLFEKDSRNAKKVRALARKALEIENALEREIHYIVPKNNSDKEAEKYFSVLGIKPTSDKGRIRNAYIGRAKERHPDINKTPGAEAAMKELNEAYSALSKFELKPSSEENDSKTIIGMEKVTLELYSKLRKSDYERLIGMVRGGISKDALIGLVDDFCDWNRRFEKVKKALVGKLDNKLMALEKHKEKCASMLPKINGRDVASISALNQCINGINESLREGYAFRSNADAAFDRAREKIISFEEESTKRLRNSVR